MAEFGDEQIDNAHKSYIISVARSISEQIKDKRVSECVCVCVWVWRYASILRPDRLTQPPVSRTRQMGDIKRSMPWQGSLSKLGRTVTGVMFWQGIKCLLRRRPVCHSARLMYRYRWQYNACPWWFGMYVLAVVFLSSFELTFSSQG